MSKAASKHESLAKKRRRGPKNKADDEQLRGVRKSSKQRRPAAKTNLRKDWL